MFAIIHVLDPHKNKQMCGKVVSENPGMLQFILNCFETQELGWKAVDYYPHAMR